MEKENHYYITSQAMLDKVTESFRKWCADGNYTCYAQDGIMNYANIINNGITFSICMFDDSYQMAFMVAWRAKDCVELSFKVMTFEPIENVSVPDLQAFFKTLRDYIQDGTVDEMMCRLLSDKMAMLDRKTLYYHNYVNSLACFGVTKYKDLTLELMPTKAYNVRLIYNTIVEGQIYARSKEEAKEILKQKYADGSALKAGMVIKKDSLNETMAVEVI